MYLPELLYKCTKQQLFKVLKKLKHRKLPKSTTKQDIIGRLKTYDDTAVISSLEDGVLRKMLLLQGLSKEGSDSTQRKRLFKSLYPADSYQYTKKDVLNLLQELIGFIPPDNAQILDRNIVDDLKEHKIDGALNQFQLIHHVRSIWDTYDSIYKNVQIVKHKPAQVIIGFTFYESSDGEIWTRDEMSGKTFEFLVKKNITVQQELEIYCKGKDTEVYRQVISEKRQ